MVRAITAQILIAVMLLAGCGTVNESGQKATTSSAKPSPAETKVTPFEPPALEIGIEADLGPLDATLLDYKRDVEPNPFDADKRSDAIRVRVCNVNVEPQMDEEYLFSSISWALLEVDFDSHHDIYKATGPDTLQPPFPDRDLTVGECAKGWIFFSLPKNIEVTRAAYGTQDLGAGFWHLG